MAQSLSKCCVPSSLHQSDPLFTEFLAGAAPSPYSQTNPKALQQIILLLDKGAFPLVFSIFLLPVTTFYSHTCKYKLLHHSDTLSTAFLAEEAPSPFSQITLKQLRNIILTYLQRSCSSFTLFSKNFQTASADHTDFSTKSVNLCNGGVFGHANSLASCLLLSFRERVNFVSDPSLHYSRYYFLASYFFLCYRG